MSKLGFPVVLPQTALPDELKGPVLAAYRAPGFLRADG